MEKSQPLKIIDDEYRKFSLLRELEHIHNVMNDRLDELPTVVSLTASYSLKREDAGKIFLVDTSVARSLFLPQPEAGLSFRIKDKTGSAATNNITIVRFASEAIEGTGASLVLSTNFRSIFLLSDGLNWFLL